MSKKAAIGLAAVAGASVLALRCGGSVSRSTSDASLEGGGTSSSSGSTSSTSSGGSGGGTCKCAPLLSCCNQQCLNLTNDPHNCGGCGAVCPDSTPYCSGRCTTPPCDVDAGCASGTCCGAECCSGGQICCLLETGGPAWTTACYTLQSGETTCPVGCPACR
jgi:hypothetical protein